MKLFIIIFFPGSYVLALTIINIKSTKNRTQIQKSISNDQIDQKTIQNRSQIDPKSIQNRAKIDPKCIKMEAWRGSGRVLAPKRVLGIVWIDF